MAKIPFKDMTLDQLRKIAADEGAKCTAAEKDFIDDRYHRNHGGMGFDYARRHWTQRGNVWTPEIAGYLKAMRRVLTRERFYAGRNRNRGLRNSSFTNRKY